MPLKKHLHSKSQAAAHIWESLLHVSTFATIYAAAADAAAAAAAAASWMSFGIEVRTLRKALMPKVTSSSTPKISPTGQPAGCSQYTL
jgi:hypothetical protein